MKRAVAVAALSLLAACTTGQANTTPPISTGGGGSTNYVLQLSLGTVNFGQPGEVGMNLFETFRDPSGFTAVPITTATLTGPPGFEGPKGSKDPGSGMHTIPIGAHSDQFLVSPAGTTTVLAGADGFGIGPPGCGCAGINFYPFQPQFVEAVPSFFGQTQPYYGGPPAYPPTTLAASALSALVQIPSSWAEGFYFIALSKLPPAGQYTFAVTYVQNGTQHTARATATLHPRLLRLFSAAVSAVSDHKGGVTVTVPFPSRVQQVLVNVIDANVPPAPSTTPCNTGLGFATLRFEHGGTQSVPNDLGNYGKGGARTFCKGDTLNVQVIGFDYDNYDLGPPGNTEQAPKLPPSADITYTTVVVTE